mgnify:CR=1 FL=1
MYVVGFSNDVLFVMSIILNILSALIAIIAIIISRKVHRIQAGFSEKIISIVNKGKAEVKNENQKIINDIINIEKMLPREEYVKQLEDVIDNEKTTINKLAESEQLDAKIVELMQEHHEFMMHQSMVQFQIGVIAAIIGVIFIIAIVAVSDSWLLHEYIVNMLPVVIVEVVSVYLFSKSKEMREHASEFLDRLREHSQFARSIAIVDTIEGSKLKNLVKAEMALHLCGINIDLFTDKSIRNLIRKLVN